MKLKKIHSQNAVDIDIDDLSKNITHCYIAAANIALQLRELHVPTLWPNATSTLLDNEMR